MRGQGRIELLIGDQRKRTILKLDAGLIGRALFGSDKRADVGAGHDQLLVRDCARDLRREGDEEIPFGDDEIADAQFEMRPGFGDLAPLAVHVERDGIAAGWHDKFLRREVDDERVCEDFGINERAARFCLRERRRFDRWRDDRVQ